MTIDLASRAGIEDHPSSENPTWGTDAMRIFFSAGEPSGDLHGANLMRSLRGRHADVDFVGFGGDKMQAAGCQLLYPLSQLALMGIFKVVATAPTFLSLLSRADRFFKHQRPDAVVLIDYPGFNWWIARRAHFHGIPVFYFVPPQLWAWAGWRVKKMRRFVDHVLCSLPFEEQWYRDRGVAAHYVGHPYFDELPAQQLDAEFLSRHSQNPVVALLPGSRNQEVNRNLPMLIESAQLIHKARPDARFLVANYKQSQQQHTDAHVQGCGLPIETHVGRTSEIIHVARACIAVSGSVGLELLHHGTPSTVVYKIDAFEMWMFNKLRTTRFISLVNLLAQKELFPEFLTTCSQAEAMAGQVLGWLNDDHQYGRIRGELAALRNRVAQPGACSRAADFIVDVVRRRMGQPKSSGSARLTVAA
jgi:lipid-A-disaccharide synthase